MRFGVGDASVAIWWEAKLLQLIIPACDEELRLPKTLRRLRDHVDSGRDGFGGVEVIVVDNASRDRTSLVAAAGSSPQMPVRVVHCATRGKGAAVRVGMASTDADLVGFMDADGATGLDAFAAGRWELLRGADMVIGSRAVAGAVADVRHSPLRRIGAAAYRGLAARVVPGICDTQCGFKLMRGELGRGLFADLRTIGFSFDVEILAQALRRGARIAELPVEWTDVPGSTFDPVRHGAASFRELMRIARHVRREAGTAAEVALDLVDLADLADLAAPRRPFAELDAAMEA